MKTKNKTFKIKNWKGRKNVKNACLSEIYKKIGEVIEF